MIDHWGIVVNFPLAALAHLGLARTLDCRSDRIFISTNESNTGMQALLARLHTSAAAIYRLDPDDPELVYCKRLRHAPGPPQP